MDLRWRLHLLHLFGARLVLVQSYAALYRFDSLLQLKFAPLRFKFELLQEGVCRLSTRFITLLPSVIGVLPVQSFIHLAGSNWWGLLECELSDFLH